MNLFRWFTKKLGRSFIIKPPIKKIYILKPIILISLYNFYKHYYKNNTTFCWMEALNYKLSERKKYFVFSRYLRANATIEDKFCYGNLQSQNIYYACIFDGHGGCQVGKLKSSLP